MEPNNLEKAKSTEQKLREFLLDNQVTVKEIREDGIYAPFQGTQRSEVLWAKLQQSKDFTPKEFSDIQKALK